MRLIQNHNFYQFYCHLFGGTMNPSRINTFTSKCCTCCFRTWMTVATWVMGAVIYNGSHHVRQLPSYTFWNNMCDALMWTMVAVLCDVYCRTPTIVHVLNQHVQYFDINDGSCLICPGFVVCFVSYAPPKNQSKDVT